MIPRGLKFITVSLCLEERRSKIELLQKFSTPVFQPLHIKLFETEVFIGRILALVKYRVVASQSSLCLSLLNEYTSLRKLEIGFRSLLLLFRAKIILEMPWFEQVFHWLLLQAILISFFHLKSKKKITKLKMILFSVHLPSKWTSDEGTDSPFYLGCSMFTSSHRPVRWLSRLLSQGCLLPGSAKEDGWRGRPEYWSSREAVWNESILSAGK